MSMLIDLFGYTVRTTNPTVVEIINSGKACRLREEVPATGMTMLECLGALRGDAVDNGRPSQGWPSRTRKAVD